MSFVKKISSFRRAISDSQMMPAVVTFSVVGIGLALMAWLSANSLWFGSEARWDGTSFLLMFLYGTLALVFLSLAGWVVRYVTKPYASRSVFSERKVVTIGLAVIFGVVVWLTGIFYLSKYIDKQVYLSRTAETPAEIISESSYTSGKGKSVTTTYTVRYNYVVDGRNYQAVSDSYKPLKKGAAVKACYNPANPKSSQIRNADFQCGKEEWYE